MIKTLNTSKHSGLLCPFISNKENIVLWIQSQITTLHFLHNLQIGPLSYSDRLWIWSKGLSVANNPAYCAYSRVTKKMKYCEYSPWFQTLHFLHSLWMGSISYSVRLCKDRKACQNQTLWLIVHICKWQKIKCCEYSPR